MLIINWSKHIGTLTHTHIPFECDVLIITTWWYWCNSRFAEEHERKDDWPASVLLYKKCLQAASESGDVRARGQATYRLGVACAAMGDKAQVITSNNHSSHLISWLVKSPISYSIQWLSDNPNRLKSINNHIMISAKIPVIN
jgi:hypothetical protein